MLILAFTNSAALVWKVLVVSRFGFHAWLNRGPSARQQIDERLSCTNDNDLLLVARHVAWLKRVAVGGDRAG